MLGAGGGRAWAIALGGYGCACKQSKGAPVTPADVSTSPFLRACRGEPVDRVPVWFMRQAGRSLPEYRAVRERHSILDVCRSPELATEVTLQPVRRLGVDAAILFSDIAIPLMAMGARVDIRDGVGPVIADPVRTGADVASLRPLDADLDTPYVVEAVSRVVERLEVPLIGFAGAPFTLASYLIEGGPTRDHARTKALMLGQPETWRDLMELLVESVVSYSRAQVRAGAAAVQLFDSWVGVLSPDDYRVCAFPYVQKIFSSLSDLGAPRIYFGLATGELLEPMANAGPDVLSVDWRVPLDRARARLPRSMVLQGNLDPAACLAPWSVVAQKVADVLDAGSGGPHVFNLGHGVLPDTDPEILRGVVDLVHAWDRVRD
jgi:uroporphyrinogen decarboxylase